MPCRRGTSCATARLLLVAVASAGCSLIIDLPAPAERDESGAETDGSIDDAEEPAEDGRRDDGSGSEDAGEDVADDADDGEILDVGPCDATGPELCNGLDDDCDTLTDEDFDLSTDMANCGECGATCDPANAVGECVDGGCQIVSCTEGWVDLNDSSVDGCEYECMRSAPSESPDDSTCSDGFDNDCDGLTDAADTDCATCVPEFCDGLDNDCDGLTDEDFDTDFDVMNCGSCDTLCRGWPNASPTCVLGECYYECEPGWSDLDGLRWNGCEATCVPSADPGEVACNGVDDDCDGRTDEDYVPYQCGAGLCERDSVCSHGMPVCEPRDPPALTDTTCDGVDDDCDGTADEDWIATGCVGACIDTATCTEGVPQCGPPAATDDTCDGIDDDCDGVADEDYTSRSCGIGACARMSTCVLGIDRCREGTPSPETCNGIDDDCDGTTDEGC